MEKETKLEPFDVTVCHKLKDACADVLAKHPEVNNIACIISWNGNLNDADINHGIWLGDSGPVNSANGIVGAMYQSLRMLEIQLRRASDLTRQLENKLIEQYEKFKKLEDPEEEKTEQGKTVV
jgi:hypothetical protein